MSGAGPGRIAQGVSENKHPSASAPGAIPKDIPGTISGEVPGGIPEKTPGGRAGRAVALTSKYDPGGEAAKLLAEVDFAKTACLVLLGLGLGYHAHAAAESLGDTGLLVIYEPDVALLRAVLEHQPGFAKLLAKSNVVLLGGTDVDRATMLQHLEPHGGLLTQGTQLVTLPLTRKRHAEAIHRFGQSMTEVVAYCRTNIATALVNASRTCRNLANNLDVYAAGATTDELLGAAKGYPAVCVGAGPSLVKNIDLLCDPEVRKNIVVIAVQTTLKPLLDRGIRPDFVTALDYSPICARFYEGLPDLPDVTLVAEPKAHAAILDAFPGPVRVCHSPFNDQLLAGENDTGTAEGVSGEDSGDISGGGSGGGGLVRPITPIKGGATVAHLSFYLAQHLGCEPIMFIGQDLGFSDGLYYAPGTAVHQVWDCELNPFNTIEMMEWQRIVRMRGHLRRFEDIHGRPIFSDEQMLTYLKQFERDFADAKEQGQLIIDATEGGMPKDHTTRMSFADALAEHATRPVPALPVPPRGLDEDRLAQLDALLRQRIAEVRDLRQVSRACIDLLRKMDRHVKDGNKPKLDKLFAKLDRHRSRIDGDLRRPFALVNQLNAIGTFRRHRADRAIARATHNPRGKLADQIQRDQDNIDWIIQACDEALTIFQEAHTRATRTRPQKTQKTGKNNVASTQRDGTPSPALLASQLRTTSPSTHTSTTPAPAA